MNTIGTQRKLSHSSARSWLSARFTPSLLPLSSHSHPLTVLSACLSLTRLTNASTHPSHCPPASPATPSPLSPIAHSHHSSVSSPALHPTRLTHLCLTLPPSLSSLPPLLTHAPPQPPHARAPAASFGTRPGLPPAAAQAAVADSTWPALAPPGHARGAARQSADRRWSPAARGQSSACAT